MSRGRIAVGPAMAAAASLTAGCMGGAVPSVDPQSAIAAAVGQEYRRFIDEARAELGPRAPGADGALAPVSAPIAPGAGPDGLRAPARVEALPASGDGPVALWQAAMTVPRFEAARVASFEVDELVDRMLARSNQIAAFSDLPLIRDTAVRQARASWDPILFAEAETTIEDRRRSSALETGTSPGAPENLEEEGFGLRFGLRQRLISGGEVTVSQDLGANSSNSEFFIPDPQSDAGWRVELRQPLLEGAGVAVNAAPVQIAEIERDQSVAELQRQVEGQLIEVIRAYWTLYQERGRAILRERLAGRLGRVAGALASREALDALPSETAQARAALSRARASGIRAEAGVRNAEARLASLLSDPSIFGERVEIIPAQPPVSSYADVPLEDVARLALENRAELRSAALALRAAELRREVARNRLLPSLDAFAAVYNGGLTDGEDLPGAVGRQFDQSDTDFAAGLRLEVPLGNERDRAVHDRRRLEVRQLTSQLRNVADTVLLEAQIGVREARTAWEEMQAREAELAAADAQAAALRARWDGGLDVGPAVLATYLSALEQQGAAQERLLEAVASYNLALYTLERVAGTMLEARGIGAARVRSELLDYVVIVRGDGTPAGPGLGADMFRSPAAAARPARDRAEDDAAPGG